MCKKKQTHTQHNIHNNTKNITTQNKTKHKRTIKTNK